MQNCIADLRRSIKMRQRELANDANVSRPHLSRIENEEAEPGGEVMLRIITALSKKAGREISVEEIFFNNDVV
jgi:DNA-binding XRE family transcriptional regulator